MLRLRSALRDFFPAALQTFGDLDASDTLELLAKGPDPDRAAHLSRAKTLQVQPIPRTGQLRQPPLVQCAYETIGSAEVALIASLSAGSWN